MVRFSRLFVLLESIVSIMYRPALAYIIRNRYSSWFSDTPIHNLIPNTKLYSFPSLNTVDMDRIKIQPFPKCKTCAHFLPHTSVHLPYKANESLGKCMLYGKRLHTNITIYEYADHCRINREQCSIEGKNYEKTESSEYK